MVNRPDIRRFVRGASAAILCMGLALGVFGKDSPPLATNAEVRALVVKDIDDKSHQPLAGAGQKATVFFFVLHDCPLANTYAPEINRIATEYQARSVRSFLVYVEPDLSPKVARKHARDHGFTCPVLLDREQQLMRFTGVAVSPEVAVLSPENALLYRGRIDDRSLSPGKQRVTPTKRDLRDALDAIIEGKPVPVSATKAVGCYLPTHDDTKPQKLTR